MITRSLQLLYFIELNPWSEVVVQFWTVPFQTECVALHFDAHSPKSSVEGKMHNLLLDALLHIGKISQKAFKIYLPSAN